MRLRIKLVTLLVMISLSLGFAASQPSSSEVVVVSDTESGLMAKPLGDKLDSPVLNVEEDYVPGPTSKAINRIGAEEVIIVGGENQVSSEVEDKLEKKAGSVTRISEDNSIDTSIAMSNKYWSDGSEELTIVQGEAGNTDIAPSLKNTVSTNEGPVLMAKPGSLGNTVLSEVERISPEEVTVYAYEPKNVEEALREEGAKEVKVVHRGDIETDFDERISEEVKEMLVMPSDSEEGLNAISSGSHSTGVVVDNRAEIYGVVEAAQRSNVEKAVVAGDSSLARAAVVAFRTRTDIEVEKKYESSSATVEVAFEG